MSSFKVLVFMSFAVFASQAALAAPSVDQNAGTYTDGLKDSTGLQLSDPLLSFGVKHDPFARQVTLIPGGTSGQVATVFVIPTSFDGWGKVYLDYTASQLTGPTPDLRVSFYGYTGVTGETPQIFPLTIVPSDDPAYDGMASLASVPVTFKAGRVVLSLAERVIVVGQPDPTNGETDDIKLRPTLNGLRVTWSPRSLLRVGNDVTRETCSGASLLYKVPVSVSLVRATGLVVWAPIPAAAPDLFNKTYPASPELISNNGTVVSAGTVVGGVTIPVTSVVWTLGDVDPGSTFTLSYSLRFPTGILDQTKYANTTFAAASNANQVSSPAVDVTVRSNPLPEVYKSSTGTFLIGGKYYVNGGQQLGYTITARNSVYTGTCQQNFQRAVIWDDVSDLVAPVEAGWTFGSVFATPPGFTISDGGLFTATAMTVDGVAVPAKAIYWQLGELPVGSSRNVSFSMTLKPDVKRGGTIPAEHLIHNMVRLESGHDTERATGVWDVYVTIPDDPRGQYAKGDRIRGGGSVHAGEDNLGRSVTYGEPFQFLLLASDAGASALVDTWMFDRIPDGALFASAFLPASARGTTYYNTTGGSNAAGDPPGVLPTGALDASWDTTPPPDPTTVRWVAFHIPRLASGYFPEANAPSSVTAEITVTAPAQGEACPSLQIVNTAAFRTLRYVGVGQTEVQPTNTTGYVLNSENVDVRPVRPSFYYMPFQTSVSPPIRNGTGNVDFYVTATNADQFGNEVDTALDVAITLQLPKLKINGVLSPLPFGGIEAPGGSVELTGLPNSVVVRYPTIAPNTSRTIIVHSNVPRGFVSGDGFSISASLSSRDDLCGLVTASSSATGTVGGNPFLRVSKKTDLAVVAPLTDVRYSLSFVNTGDAVSTRTWIVDRIPDLTTFKLAQSLGGGGEVWFSDKGVPVLPGSLRDPTFRFDDAAVRANFQKGVTLPSGSVVAPAAMGEVTWIAFLVDNATLVPPQLPIGDPRTAIYTVTVDEDAVGTIRNEAAVFADAHFPAISNEVLTIISPDPSIEVQRICPEVVAAGETFTYTVDYLNNSTNEDYAVQLVETLDAGVTFVLADHTWNPEAQARVGAIDPQPDVDGDVVTFDIGAAIQGSGPLLSFEGGRIAYRVRVDANLPSGSFLDLGGLATTSDVTGELTTSLFGGCRVLVENADLFARKVVDQPSPVSGETVTYSIIISNEGANDADNVAVVDNLPVGVSYVAGSALVTTSGWRLSANSEPTIATVAGAQRLTWSVAGNNALQLIGDVAGHFPGRSGDVALSFRARLANNVLPATTLTNRVSVTTPSGEDPIQPNTGTVDVRTPLPDPYVSKSGQTFAQPGASITYRFRYGNESRQSSGPVLVVDKLYDAAPANGAVDVTYIGHTAPSTNSERMYFNAASLSGAEPAFDPANPGATGWTTSPTSLTEVRWVALYAPSLPGSSGPFSAYLDVALRTPSSGLTPLPGASIQNCATIRQLGSPAPGDDSAVNNQGCVTTRTPGIDVAIDTTCDPSGLFPGIVPGKEAKLTLTLTNNGTVAAYGLRATWTPPDWFLPSGDDAGAIVAVDENGNAVLLLDATGTPINDPVMWTKNGNDFVLGALAVGAPRYYRKVALPAGAMTTITIRGTVAGNVPNQTAVTQGATVTTDYRFDFIDGLDEEEEILTNNQSSCGTTVYRADPLVIKTAAASGPFNAGERVRWQIAYQNAGDAPADDMVIDDVLPEGVPYVVGSFTNKPDGAELRFDDGSGNFDYTPVGADGDIDPNVRAIRLAWEGAVPAPANATFVQDSAQDFASGSFVRTLADGGKVIVDGRTGSTTGTYTSPVIPAPIDGNVLDWSRLLVDATLAADASLEIAVLDGMTGELIAEGLQPDDAGAIALDIDPAEHPTIRLRASLDGAGLACDYTKDRVVPLASAVPVPVEYAALGCVGDLVTGTTIEAGDGTLVLNPLVWERGAGGFSVAELPVPEGFTFLIGQGGFDEDLLLGAVNGDQGRIVTWYRTADGWQHAVPNGRFQGIDAEARLLLTQSDDRLQIEFFDGSAWQAVPLDPPQGYDAMDVNGLMGGAAYGNVYDELTHAVVWRAADLGFEGQVLPVPEGTSQSYVRGLSLDGLSAVGYRESAIGLRPALWRWNGSSWDFVDIGVDRRLVLEGVTPNGTLVGEDQDTGISSLLRRSGSAWVEQRLDEQGHVCAGRWFDGRTDHLICSSYSTDRLRWEIWRPSAAGAWTVATFPVPADFVFNDYIRSQRRDHAVVDLYNPETGEDSFAILYHGTAATTPVGTTLLEQPETSNGVLVAQSLTGLADCTMVEGYGNTPAFRGWIWEVEPPSPAVIATQPFVDLGGPDRTTQYTAIRAAENDTLLGVSLESLTSGQGEGELDGNATITVWMPDVTGVAAHVIGRDDYFTDPRTIGPGGEIITNDFFFGDQRAHAVSWLYDPTAGAFVPHELPGPAAFAKVDESYVYHDTISDFMGGYDPYEGALEGYLDDYDDNASGMYGVWVYSPSAPSHWVWANDLLPVGLEVDEVEAADGTVTVIDMYSVDSEEPAMIALVRDGATFTSHRLRDVAGNPIGRFDAFRSGVIAARDEENSLLLYLPDDYDTAVPLLTDGYVRAISGAAFGDTGLPLVAVYEWEIGDTIWAPDGLGGYQRVTIEPPQGYAEIDVWDNAWPQVEADDAFFDDGPSGFEHNVVGGFVKALAGPTAAIVVPDDTFTWQSYILAAVEDENATVGNSTIDIVMVGEGPTLYGVQTSAQGHQRLVGYTFPGGDLASPNLVDLSLPATVGEMRYAEPLVPTMPAGATGAIAAGFGIAYQGQSFSPYRAIFFVPQGDTITTVVSQAITFINNPDGRYPVTMSASSLVPIGRESRGIGLNGGLWGCVAGGGVSLDRWEVVYRTDKNPSFGYELEVPDVCQSRINNTATLTTSSPEITQSNDQSTASVSVQSAELRVTADASDSTVLIGDTLYYTFIVENLGPGPATDVVIDVAVPDSFGTSGGQTRHDEIDVLQPGEEVEYFFEVSIDTDGLYVPFVGTVAVEASSIDCDAGDDVASATAITGNLPNVYVEVTGPGAPIPAATGSTWEVEVGNDGNAPATNVVATGTVPPGSTIESISVTQGACTALGLSYSCTIGTLEGHGEAQPAYITIVLGEAACGAIGSNVVVTATATTDLDIDQSDNSDQASEQVVAARGQLTLQVTPGSGTVEIGDDINYLVHYRNNGSETISSATIVLTAPAGTTVIEASLNGGAQYLGSGATLTVTDLAPGEVGSFSVATRYQATVPTGTAFVAQVAASGEGLCPTAAAGAPTIVGPRGLHISKQASSATGCGDPIDWVISVRNSGASPVAGVVVTDAVASEAAYLTGSIKGPGANATGAPVLVWQVGSIAPGQAVTLGYRSNAPASAGSSVANVAKLEVGGVIVAQSAPTVVRAECDTALRVTKEWTAGCVTPGQSAVVTLRYLNSGRQSLTDVVLTDYVSAGLGSVVVPDGATFANGVVSKPIGTLAPGQSGTFSYLLQVNAPAGELVLDVAAVRSSESEPATSNQVTGVVVSCDDGNPCTADTCALFVGCVNTLRPLEGVSDATCNGVDDDCDVAIDEDYVPTRTTCGQGVCATEGQLVCLPGATAASNTCTPLPRQLETDTTCNRVDEDCNGASDEDYVGVTVTCGFGACAGSDVTSCSDGEVTNECVPLTNGTECVDDDLCSDRSACLEGRCVATRYQACDDDNDCTFDSCNPSTGCAHSAVDDGSDCNDVNACTSNDECQDGTCVGVGIGCADPDACHFPGECNPGTGACEYEVRPGDLPVPLRISDLGTLGGATSTAVGVNAAGLVIGTSDRAAGEPHAFGWTASGGMIDLTPNRIASRALALNEAGLVVGTVETEGPTAFTWTAADGLTVMWAVDGTEVLGPTASGKIAGNGLGDIVYYSADGRTFAAVTMPGGSSAAEVTALNDSGTLVGELTTGGERAAWRRVGGGGVEVLIELGGVGDARANAVNASNVAVGWAELEGERHAAMWRADGTMVDLDTLVGGAAEALAIDDTNRVYGNVTLADGTSRAFLWTEAAGMVDIGGGLDASVLFMTSGGLGVGAVESLLGVTSPAVWSGTSLTLVDTLGSDFAQPTAASGAAVVGSITRSSGTRAFFWTAARGTQDLGTLGGSGATAHGVSSAGRVVGQAQLASGAGHAFISTAPTTACIVCDGDEVAPLITCPVAPRAVECEAGGNAVTLGVPSVSDACGEDVTVTDDAPVTFEPGTTIVTFTATDTAENSASCTTAVAVTDTEAPTIQCAPTLSVTANEGICGAVVTLAATAVDGCDGTDVTLLGPGGPISEPVTLPPGESSVTITAIDRSGNTATCTTLVTVGEAGALQITCDEELTVDAPADFCGYPSALSAEVVDACNLGVTVESANDEFPIGVTNVSFEASNDRGQSDTCVTKLTVRDVTAPSVLCGYEDAANPAAVPAVFVPTASDACGVTLSVSGLGCFDAAGQPVSDRCEVRLADANVIVSNRPDGDVEVRWLVTATDPSGNVTDVACATKPDTSLLDRDRDTILDGDDNCIEEPNTDQSNLDEDDLGDACDDTPFTGLQAEGSGGCAGGGAAGLLAVMFALVVVTRRRRLV